MFGSSVIRQAGRVMVAADRGWRQASLDDIIPKTMTATTTRLAPSPTGALHIGNARTFLINHLMAVTHGWRMLMRVEDLDGPRVKPAAAAEMLNDLAWLGLAWDDAIIYQTRRADAYRAALKQLIEIGAAYPCTCSRKDIELAASAPHLEDALGAYPGTCRDRYDSAEQAAAESGRPVAWRVRLGEEPFVVDDAFQGETVFTPAELGGDFAIFKNTGTAAYQLAVVVDDAATGVDAIVRGHDLLDSAARQTHLRRLLGLTPEPETWHLPLVIGPDGLRLAKRHGDSRLATYRQHGVPAERLLGVLGHLSGLLSTPRPAGMDELLERFDLDRLSKKEVVFTADHHAFLLGQD